jgi:hypothetical protein
MKAKVDLGSAWLMNEDGWGAIWAAEPSVAPLHQGHKDGGELTAHVGQSVLITWRMFGVLALDEHPGINETLETLGKNCSRDFEVSAELIEAMEPSKGVPQNQDRPSVANYVKGGGNRAW